MSQLRTNVPKLRFPEFRNAGDWEGVTLGNVVKYENGKAHEKGISESGNFIVVNSKFISTDGDVKKFTCTAFCLAEKEDILMVLSDLPNGRALAKCFLVNADNIYTVNQRICKLTVNKTISIMLFYTLNRNSYFLAFDDGVKQTNLKKDDVLNCLIFLPKDLEEQQKIANCLSSIDELINTQNKKVETLKAHKKGLMQQLFPSEGETVPKLRFPEFHSSGDWKKVKLGQLGELVSGLTYNPNDVRDKGLLVLRSSNVQNGEIELKDKVFVTPDIKGANLSQPNDILICIRNGSKALIGKNALIPEDMPLCTHGAFMTVFRTQLAKFTFQLFQTIAYKNQVDADLGATINSINGKHFIKYEFYVPHPKEQQKIADCLSSLDKLINTQNQKVEALKTHKKGLMQQLFPSMNEGIT